MEVGMGRYSRCRKTRAGHCDARRRSSHKIAVMSTPGQSGARTTTLPEYTLDAAPPRISAPRATSTKRAPGHPSLPALSTRALPNRGRPGVHLHFVEPRLHRRRFAPAWTLFTVFRVTTRLSKSAFRIVRLAVTRLTTPANPCSYHKPTPGWQAASRSILPI